MSNAVKQKWKKEQMENNWKKENMNTRKNGK
jgi:hypothetical protein